MADTTAKSQISSFQVDTIISSYGYAFMIPDSLLKNNRRVNIDLKTTCTGKAIGGRLNAFIKRVDKANGCDQWGEQAP